MNIIRAAAIFAAASLCAGCATVIEGTTQPITVDTSPVIGANCTATNSAGTWTLVTPGTIVIHKGLGVLSIVCSKEGYADAKYFASGRMSSTSMISGMVPYVGILNSVVDASSGAALSYPNNFAIEMKPLPRATPVAAATPAPVPATTPAAPAAAASH